jgi:hypothetical protein
MQGSDKNEWTAISKEVCESIVSAREDVDLAVEDLLTKVPPTFGDLTALAGDHAGDVPALKTLFCAFTLKGRLPQGLWEQTTRLLRLHDWSERPRILATRRHWLNACRWFSNQDGKPVNSIHDDDCPFRVGSSPYAPDRLEQAEFEALDHYTGLAAGNRAHFPPHSWQTYLVNHFHALQKAVEYRTNKDKNILFDALIHEGFAQHFLHDSYSSGHIGTEFGSCFPPFQDTLFCSPAKNVIQHTHDTLNKIGLQVIGQYRGRETSWTAFGDDSLFVRDANFHREAVTDISRQSLAEVFQAAHDGHRDEWVPVCKKWWATFPTQRYPEVDPKEDLCGLSMEEFAKVGATKAAYMRDARVVDAPLEGWKIMISYGEAFGKFNELNSDFTLRKSQNTFGGGSIEFGYIRSTDWWKPNYLGFGAFTVPAIQNSLYPASIGWWTTGKSHLLWGGARVNLGSRLQEPFTQQNASSSIKANGEMSAVLDFGVEIYPPFALYARWNVYSLIIEGVGQPATTRARSEYPGNGSTAITFGLRIDLANIQ